MATGQREFRLRFFGDFVTVEDEADLLNSLEHCRLSLELVASDLLNWKWCLLAAHSATQIGAVITLKRAGPLQHLHRDSRNKRLEYFDKLGTPEQIDYPLADLNTFEHLIDSVWPLLAAHPDDTSLRRRLKSLGEIRDGWVHFGDHGWALHIRFVRQSIVAGLDLIDRMFPFPEALFRQPDRAGRFGETLTSLRTRLSSEDEWNVTAT
jgi:hypothetical protein